MDRGGAALALDRMVGGSIQRIRRGNLAEEQLRPDGGIPGPALLRGRGGPRGARCRARDHDGGHHLVRRHRPGGAARAHRRHPPVRARPAHPRARREPPRGPHRGAAAHGVGLRRRDRQPALVAARGERRARRPAREARLGRVAMLEKNYLWRVYWRLAGVIMVCVVIALAAVSYFSHRVFDRELVPETEQKAATVAASVRALVLKATSYGIDFDALYGVEPTFAEVIEENPEFTYMAVTNTEGNVLYSRGNEPIGARSHFRSPVVLQTAYETEDTWKAARVGPQYVVTVPIAAEAKPLGLLHIGIDATFVDHVLFEVLLDVVVVLVVSLFFTLELLNFMAGARLASGLGEFARQVDRMRAGNFTATARVRANDRVGRLLRRIDSAVDHPHLRSEFL